MIFVYSDNFNKYFEFEFTHYLEIYCTDVIINSTDGMKDCTDVVFEQYGSYLIPNTDVLYYCIIRMLYISSYGSCQNQHTDVLFYCIRTLIMHNVGIWNVRIW